MAIVNLTTLISNDLALMQEILIGSKKNKDIVFLHIILDFPLFCFTHMGLRVSFIHVCIAVGQGNSTRGTE